MFKVRILIIDDHPIFSAGLRKVLSFEPDFLVVGEAHSGANGILMACELAPDLILLDNRIPGATTVGILTELKRKEWAGYTLLLADEISQAETIEVLRFGVRGVLGKDADRDLVLRS